MATKAKATAAWKANNPMPCHNNEEFFDCLRAAGARAIGYTWDVVLVCWDHEKKKYTLVDRKDVADLAIAFRERLSKVCEVKPHSKQR